MLGLLQISVLAVLVLFILLELFEGPSSTKKRGISEASDGKEEFKFSLGAPSPSPFLLITLLLRVHPPY